MKKRALISVYDKSGITDFARDLVDMDWEIISTGGTYALLKDQGLDPILVEDLTGSKEILGSRVKTLHPAIYGGILFRRDNEEDIKTIKELDISPIDMVVSNLYPFEEVLKNENSSHEEIIENIDIGGPSMVRAAGKNYKDLIIVSCPEDYKDVIEYLRKDQMTLEIRKGLAAKAFRMTAFYDSMISQYFNTITQEFFPEKISMPYRYKKQLSYGENPHQQAAFYENPLKEDFKIEKLHGKEISYNNYNDIYSSINIVKEFDQGVCVAMKHTNPCGVALGEDPSHAYQRAYECDSQSIYGGIIAFNMEVDERAAEKMKEIFLEIVIAPSFTSQALAILGQKENIRLIKCENINSFKGTDLSFKESLGGVLVQESDKKIYKDHGLELKAGEGVGEEALKDLDLAWKVVKYCSSNAITLAKNGQVIGIGNGQVRRVWALENAISRSEINVEGAVAASDGFFFPDTIKCLHDNGIKAVVQPGGSIQDEQVIDLARQCGISLYFTGMRHFKH